MNYSTAVFLINKSVRAIVVSYDRHPNKPDEPSPSEKLTTYKTFDPSIKPKDFVLVPTNTRWGMTVVRVESVDVDVDFDSTVQMDWIVGKVDRSDFESTHAKEAEAIAAIRSAEVRRKRDELAKALLADNEALRSLPIADSGPALPSPPPPAPEVI